MFRNKRIIFISIAILVVLSSIISISKFNKNDDKIYNIGNKEKIENKLELPAIAIFDEYVYENFKNSEFALDNYKMYRADSVVENTSSYEALENAIRMNKLISTYGKNPKIEYEYAKNLLFNNELNNLNINYFDNINHIDKDLDYINDYIDNKSIKVKESGYLVNYKDGYEDILTNNYNLDWKKILNTSKNINKMKAIKYVNNRSYTIYTYIESIDNIKKESLYNTHISVNGKEFRANLEDIILINDGFLLKLKLFDGIEEVIKNRFIELSINLNLTEGFKVPKSSLIKKNGIDGLYAIEDGKVRFIPVKIIKQENDYIYISSNISDIFPSAILNTNIEFNELKPFTKIIINPVVYQDENI